MNWIKKFKARRRKCISRKFKEANTTYLLALDRKDGIGANRAAKRMYKLVKKYKHLKSKESN